MNSKSIFRIIVAIVVAAIGAWQYHSPSSPGPAPASHGKGSSPSHQNRSGNHHPEGANNGGKSQSNQTGDFDYYLVSLSWSPAYCVTHPNDQRQCGGRGFGFVLHGLWPQKSSGGYPENCPATSQPSQASVQKTLAFMPSEKLIHHEWEKHGTCTGLSADEYLALADRAFSALALPKGFQTPSTTRNLSADEILGEFVAANPSIGKDSLSLRCSGNELEEVRVCVDKHLKPMSCGKGVRTQCGRDTVQIRSMR